MIINWTGSRTVNNVQACWAMDSRARIKHVNCRRKRTGFRSGRGCVSNPIMHVQRAHSIRSITRSRRTAQSNVAPVLRMVIRRDQLIQMAIALRFDRTRDVSAR